MVGQTWKSTSEVRDLRSMDEDDYFELSRDLETLAGAPTEEIRAVRRAFSIGSRRPLRIV